MQHASAFGEGAPHLHLHLIPRFASAPHTAAWLVADHCRAVVAGEGSPANPSEVADWVVQALQRVDQAVVDAFSPRSAAC